MNIHNEICEFFSKHNFIRNIDIETTISSLLADMDSGLDGKNSDQPMLRTWCTPPENRVKNEKVIVIDAGGTNFRSSLVSFDGEGNVSITELEKTVMPGVANELGKKDFFEQMAKNLDHLKNMADKIGFCFSYPMEITPDGDGILLGFSKEVKAPEVVGSHVGKELCDALVSRGWNRPKSIVLLNDTVAALLSGAASPRKGVQYSSYIGFILGTGLNSAYLQPEIITESGKKIEKQIIVCESGSFSKICLSDFDKSFDKKTMRPGSYIMEKNCSGAYLGPVALEILKAAADESIDGKNGQTSASISLFSADFAKKILSLETLPLIEVSKFLNGPYDSSSVLGAICAECAAEKDYAALVEILDSVAERSARYASAMLAACAIKTGEGKSADRPVCIVCNGTTFYKTPKIKDRTFAYLEEALLKKRGINFELVEVENDITLGTAIAGLSR